MLKIVVECDRPECDNQSPIRAMPKDGEIVKPQYWQVLRVQEMNERDALTVKNERTFLFCTECKSLPIGQKMLGLED